MKEIVLKAPPQVKVNATVVFSILNSFVRRNTRDSRVIGTLLGEVKNGVIVVRFVPMHLKCLAMNICLLFTFFNSYRSLTALQCHTRRKRTNYMSNWIMSTTSWCTPSTVATTRKKRSLVGTQPLRSMENTSLRTRRWLTTFIQVNATTRFI